MGADSKDSYDPSEALPVGNVLHVKCPLAAVLHLTAMAFLPVAFGHFGPFPKTSFGPRAPKTGKWCFGKGTPIIIWQKGALGVPSNRVAVLLIGQLRKV